MTGYAGLAAVALPANVAGSPSTTYNADNEQTKFNGASLSFDNNGNLSGDGTNTYTWDARNHLKQIAQGRTTIATFVYDGFGRRMSKTTSGTTTQFLYDGLNPVQELNASDGVVANLLTGLNVDEYFTRTDSSNNVSTLLTDALDSPVGLVGSGQTIATNYTYQPFGATTVGGSANGSSYEFTGRGNDGAGLYYYRARYYQPAHQRFIAQDPIEFADGNANLYAYVGNDAVNLLDPEGLWTAAVGWTSGGGAGWGGGSFTIGLAIDGNGNIALAIGGGGGVGLGADAYSGLSTSFSTAPCVTDLGGPFFNQSFGGGLGLNLNVDTFEGKAASNGAPIFGWGLTTGAGLGLGGSVGGSGTVVVPLGRL